MTMPREHPPTDRDSGFIAAYLADRDVKCPNCGYNLHGSPTNKCPECGETVTISIGHVDRTTAPWLVALIFYAMATGFSGMFTLVGLFVLIFEGFSDAEDVGMMVIFSSGFAVAASGLALIVARRQRIWGMSAAAQWLIAISVILVPMASALGGFIAFWLLT